MRSSNGEVRIFNVLCDSGLPFQEEYEFPDLVSKYGKHLRFDFCVFNRDGSILFLIEYQGKQHYVPIKRFGGEKGYHRQVQNDRLKREYCLRHGYNLVTVPYWEENNITYEYIMRSAGLEV